MVSLESENESDELAQSTRTIMKKFNENLTHLAGVTFNNDPQDGGENRQTLLKKIHDQGRPVLVSLDHCKWQDPATGKTEDAIKIRNTNGTVIGWIPRQEIPKYKNVTKAVLTVGFFSNCYYGVLSKHEAPTDKQYAYMKHLNQQGRIAMMPEYDRSIYSHALSKI